jgi:hypothetical protein
MYLKETVDDDDDDDVAWFNWLMTHWWSPVSF